MGRKVVSDNRTLEDRVLRSMMFPKLLLAPTEIG